MNYKVDPGLYALGNPGEHSPVLVTANFKMSFDKLRKALPGRDAWILVLDTKGINVWCAAGKGTFGTAELVARITACGLNQIVSHRQVILPQLAGPGVAAHQVQKLSGFKVVYGPIRAVDLPAFLDAGLKATPDMRMKTFTAWERTEVIPIELVGALKTGLPVFLFFFLADSLLRKGGFGSNALSHGVFSVIAILAAILAGAVLTPIFLPWLPGRAFSLKGLIPGVLVTLALMVFRWNARSGNIEIAAWLFIIVAISTFLAMNFTGASTYTSLSGVKKEMRWALPMQIGAAIVGFVLWLGSQFI